MININDDDDDDATTAMTRRGNPKSERRRCSNVIFVLISRMTLSLFASYSRISSFLAKGDHTLLLPTKHHFHPSIDRTICVNEMPCDPFYAHFIVIFCSWLFRFSSWRALASAQWTKKNEMKRFENQWKRCAMRAQEWEQKIVQTVLVHNSIPPMTQSTSHCLCHAILIRTSASFHHRTCMLHHHTRLMRSSERTAITCANGIEVRYERVHIIIVGDEK